MRRFRSIEISEPSPCFFSPKILTLSPYLSSCSYDDELSVPLDLLNPSPTVVDFSSSFDVFDSVTDLIQIDNSPFFSSYRRVQQKRVAGIGTELYLRSLSDRVSELELSFDRLLKAKADCFADRKYTWTAEIKSPKKDGVDRKYTWKTEIKGGKKKEEEAEKKYKWTAEVKRKGEDGHISRTYTFTALSGRADECGDSGKKEEKKDKKKKKKKDEKGVDVPRLVEIEEPFNHGVVVLRQAFSKRAGSSENCKGKRKELSRQDAAMLIQMNFRAYLIRRSKALRALRELAVAKTKLKEIRAVFNNSYHRSRITRDAEERQRFSEKIIVLLLTVDAIEGADLMVRAAKRSMVDELEAMLDAVDPQPPSKSGRSLSMKRRTFDMPDGEIQREIAAGVARVVQMLDQDEKNGNTFEACL